MQVYKNDKRPYHLDEHGIIYKKSEMDQIFPCNMVPNALQLCILYESHNALGHNDSSRLHHYIRRHCYWKMLSQHCNNYVFPCP